MKKSRWIAFRAFLAILLGICFYFVAIAVVAVLLFIPYSLYRYGHRISPKLDFLCIAGALAILWSIVPRIDKFSPPGPLLEKGKHPQLFDALTDVATSTGQAMPSEVYLVPDVNAWVTQRGGIMGFGSKRVMGIGLALMQIVSVSQLKTILAHEFGHYYQGDTKLGPWIYKTRAAIGRTIQNLAGVNSSLQLPFQLYGKMFLRITYRVSRRQEFIADQLAAQKFGAISLIEALKLISGNAVAFNAYWNYEISPIISAGFFPPITEGFRLFIKSKDVSSEIDSIVSKELSAGSSNPYDTHPSLSERIEALANLPGHQVQNEEQFAISLIDGAADLERSLVAHVYNIPEQKISELKPIAWSEVGEKINAPAWNDLLTRNAEALSEITLSAIPKIAKNPIELVRKLKNEEGREVSSAEDLSKYCLATLGVAFGITLKNRNWDIYAYPGEECYFQRGKNKIYPFKIMRQLSSGELTEEQFTELCRENGITGLDVAGTSSEGSGT